MGDFGVVLSQIRSTKNKANQKLMIKSTFDQKDPDNLKNCNCKLFPGRIQHLKSANIQFHPDWSRYYESNSILWNPYQTRRQKSDQLYRRSWGQKTKLFPVLTRKLTQISSWRQLSFANILSDPTSEIWSTIGEGKLENNNIATFRPDSSRYPGIKSIWSMEYDFL